MSSTKSDRSDREVQEPETKKARMIAPQRSWTFTWHDYPDNWIAAFSVNQGLLAGYAGGKEVCPETKRRHIQGWIDFGQNKRNRPSTLKMSKKIHWEKMKGSAEQNFKYCSKEGDYIDWGTCKKGRPFEIDIVLSPWMVKLNEILTVEPDNRSIWWIWEPNGKAGKTTFQKWYELQHRGEVLVLSGKAHDMKNGIVKFKETHQVVPRVIMCNVPRSTDERYISWQGMEEIKDMLFYSGKYEGGMVNERSPHFIMFANWKPDPSQLSVDRLNTVRIPKGRGGGEVKEHDWREPEEIEEDS